MTESPTEAFALAGAWLHGQGTIEQLHQLCALATSEDPAVAQAGTNAIFRRIVEPLGDRFDPHDCDRYLEFFSEVVHFCRQLPRTQTLDENLRAFGLPGRDEFFARGQRLRMLTPFPSERADAVKKILVLSRVTLGADVAVTSVVLSRLKEVFPAAGICLLGSAKTGSLFASDPRIRLIPVEYERGGTLLERLNAWPALAAQVTAETAGLRAEEYLVVDPDSRLTQLGLLPVAPHESSYLFFESRSYTSEFGKSLGELTSQWLNEVFDPSSAPSLPYVALEDTDAARGSRLREATENRLAVVNLGVGENFEKRLRDPFEIKLLLLLREAGYRIVLDRGAGEEELRRTGDLIAALHEQGHVVAPVDSADAALANVLTWEGSLSGLAGLIGVADLYIGYDSAGGHIAAALGVPTIDVFAGAVSTRMRERWRPWGRQPGRVIAVVAGTAPANVLRRIQEHLG
jgi:ADP-heptose:LPS heptosyltransferase